MAIAYSSAGSGVSTETSGAALSPLCPATVNAGDILIAHVFWEGTADAPSTPSGWTLLDGPRVIESTIARMWVFGKIADGTEDGAAVAFGSPAVTTQRAARVYSFTGRVDGTIAGQATGFAFLSHATDPQMPTVTTTKAGALAVALVGQNDNNTVASASGESGGNWVEAVLSYVAPLTPGLVIQIQTCTPTANPGTVTGGSIATQNDPCGVIGFQILDSLAATLAAGTNTVTITAPTATVYQGTIRAAGTNAVTFTAPTVTVQTAVTRAAGPNTVTFTAPAAISISDYILAASPNTITFSAPAAVRTTTISRAMGPQTYTLTAPLAELIASGGGGGESTPGMVAFQIALFLAR